MEDNRYKKRLNELKRIYKKLPANEKKLLGPTLERVAFLDVEMAELELLISSGMATTPDKQLYTSIAKTQLALVKTLLSRLPEEENQDEQNSDFDF